ncbi:MAG: (2Fe-2S)-binding protein [Elusimicrobiota bacterium]
MAEKRIIRFTLNGEERQFLCLPDERLLGLLRRSGFKGVKKGCEDGSCGCCTVIMDGRAVYSCILHAFQAEGRDVRTVESVGDFDRPHPFQKALAEEGAVQCGFCTPGMVMSAKALLDKDPHPSESKLKEHMDGVLCRCTGYVKIEEALRRVSSPEGGKGDGR